MTQGSTKHRSPRYVVLARISGLFGVFSLGLFLLILFSDTVTLLYADREIVQGLVRWQTTPFFIFFDTVLIILPLVGHLVFYIFRFFRCRLNVHLYPYPENLRFVMLKIAGVLGLSFVGYHVGQLYGVYFEGMAGYQYLQTAIRAHQNLPTIILYWTGLAGLGSYFFLFVWDQCIDFGICVSKTSQRVLTLVCLSGFLFYILVGLVLMIKAVFGAIEP